MSHGALGARSTSQMLLVGVESGLSYLHSRLTVLLEMAMCPK
jgi:hypothetical protein